MGLDFGSAWRVDEYELVAAEEWCEMGGCPRSPFRVADCSLLVDV